MKMIINKNQEFTKSGWISAKKDLKLFLEISVVLSSEELAMIEKYYDPEIKIFDILPDEFNDIELNKEKFKDLIDESQSSFLLSDFNIFAVSVNAYDDMIYMECIIETLENSLKAELKKLKSFSSWQGKQTKDIE